MAEKKKSKKPSASGDVSKPSSAERKIALRKAQSDILSTAKGQQYAQMMAGYLGRPASQPALRG